MIDVWVPLRLSSTSEEKIERLRNRLSSDIPVAFKEETDPHISILPGIKIPENKYDSFAERVSTLKLPADTVCLDGLGVYPLDHPFVILLECAIDLRKIREKLIDIVYGLGGRIQYPPVEPHLTLFKTGDTNHEASSLSAFEIEQLHSLITQLNGDETVPTHWYDQEYQIDVDRF